MKRIEHKFTSQEAPPQKETSQKHGEEVSSPEKVGPFDVAAEQLKGNDRALKILMLAEQGYSPSPEELKNLDTKQILGEFRKKYPTVEDIAYDLSQTVREQISVERQAGWTDEQYENAVKTKQKEYIQAAIEFRKSLEPVYEKFGAATSEECKDRIIENLRDTIRRAAQGSITGRERYFEKNILAASKQTLTPEEAQTISQIKEGYQNIYRRQFPDKQLNPEIEVAIRQIKERSGFALQEAGYKLEAIYNQREQKKPEAIESRPEKQDAIVAFMDFVREHEREIDGRLAQGDDLWAIIYHEFYNGDENKKYLEGSPEFENLKKIYEREFSRVDSELYERGPFGKKEFSIKGWLDEDWLVYGVNKDVDANRDGENIGRFYLNLKPEFTPRFFQQTIEAFNKAGLDVRLKIPKSFQRRLADQRKFGTPEEKKIDGAKRISTVMIKW